MKAVIFGRVSQPADMVSELDTDIFPRLSRPRVEDSVRRIDVFTELYRIIFIFIITISLAKLIKKHETKSQLN